MRVFLCILLAVGGGICVSDAYGANTNAKGVTLHLGTADYGSGTVDMNAKSVRLLGVGAASAGLPGSNGEGATLIVDPLSVMNTKGTVASFNADPVSGRAPLTVQFTDASNGGLFAVDSWTWTFGDGSPENHDQNPEHVYDTPGVYDVTLTITTSGGNATETKTGYITVTGTGVPAAGSGALVALGAVLMAVARFMAKRHGAGLN